MLAFFFCGALCSAGSLSEFTEVAERAGYTTQVFELDTNPFTANHERDFTQYREAIAAAISEAPEAARIYFGYSAGSKFAARLASEVDTAVDGLFLLDPVDGPPPLQKDFVRFPVFLENISPSWRQLRTQESKTHPSVFKILNSELGERAGFGGVPCVSANYGPRWFAQRMGAQANETFELKSAGHLDPLSRQPRFPGNLACPAGSKDAATKARKNALDQFSEFLASIYL